MRVALVGVSEFTVIRWEHGQGRGVFLSASNLPRASHTLEIRWTNAKNAASSGLQVVLAASLLLGREAGVPGTTHPTHEPGMLHGAT